MLDTPKATQKSHADGKILQSVDDGVGVITFNNPEKRNAMSLEMWEGLGEALIELRDNPAVRVVVLAGAGDKAFVSGADISQFEKTRHNAEASAEYSRRSEAQRALLGSYPKPTIACIRGFCLGGGMQVAMLTDMRFAAENSHFGIPAAKLGIAYGFDGLRHLVSLVGPSWARLIMAQLQHGAAERGLAAAGFTDQPQRLAAGDVEADVADGVDGLAVHDIFDDKVLDLEQRAGGRGLQRHAGTASGISIGWKQAN